MRVSHATLAALRSAAGAAGQHGSITVICTVEGGIACRLAEGSWDDPALEPLAPLLIADLGYKTVEHATRRQAVIRCTLPAGDCRIDLGEGFLPLDAVMKDV